MFSMMDAIRHWFEKHLEEPFYRAEMSRAEGHGNASGSVTMDALAEALSRNYCTLKTWSK
jgi:hypothetical protein